MAAPRWPCRPVPGVALVGLAGLRRALDAALSVVAQNSRAVGAVDDLADVRRARRIGLALRDEPRRELAQQARCATAERVAAELDVHRCPGIGEAGLVARRLDAVVIPALAGAAALAAEDLVLAQVIAAEASATPAAAGDGKVLGRTTRPPDEGGAQIPERLRRVGHRTSSITAASPRALRGRGQR